MTESSFGIITFYDKFIMVIILSKVEAQLQGNLLIFTSYGNTIESTKR